MKKRADFLIEILDTVQAISNELGQRVEKHSQASTAGDVLDIEELKAAYTAFGGIVALHDLMAVIYGLLKEEEN